MLQKLIFSLLVFCCAVQSPAQHYFDNRISVPADLPAPVMDAVKDMAYWLEKSTSHPFVIRQSDNAVQQKSIQLVWADRSDLPQAVKQQLNGDGQSFYLSVDNKRGVRITGTGTNSFNNGIYTFLQELGFRWYMPGDAWTIVPPVFKRNITINKVYTPDFRNRSYAGTGGVNAIPGTDPQNTFKSDYNTWNRRNRFNTDYPVKGHAGHLFYNYHKKVLDAHPNWFCNGKINRYGRMDISHSKVVNLFTEWALSQVKKDDRFPTIGIDPSDGAGGKDDCLPSGMKQIKTWSDKYFWLANQVAQRLDKNDTKTQVQLYAYANHAATPSFALEKNVFPVIIPYAFQNVTEPENFIKQWSDKMEGRPIGIYDYWNITQWSSGVPQFNIYQIPVKLRVWKKYNVSTINLESTNGKGAMGHVLWLGSQMMWDTQLSFDSLYHDFLSTCFGPAAGDVKNMYDRWSRNYQEALEVNLSLRDLAAASAKTSDPAIHARLRELKAYVHYLKLFYDNRANTKSGAAFQKLTDYIHDIHDLRLVQTSALLERYIKPPKDYKPAARRGTVSAARRIDIESQFRQNLRQHATTYQISDLRFDLSRAKAITSEKQVSPKFINGRNEYLFHLPAATVFEMKAGAGKETKLTITGGSRKWVDQMIPATKDGYTTIKLQLPAGDYNLSFGEFARFSRIILPTDIVFLSRGISYYDNAGYPLHYVYIPRDVDAIVYQDEKGPGVNKRGFWLDPAGKKVEPKKLSGNVYIVPVPAQHRGKVWTLNIGHRSFKMLNIPNHFSLRKFQYKED